MNSPWFVSFKKSSAPVHRLFCFHHAGGSASFCREWSSSLPAEIEVIGVQFPGRESRFGDSLVEDMATAVSQIVKDVQPLLDIPFSVFGHSMGAMVSFEFCAELKRQNLSRPAMYFPSGRQAPHINDGLALMHTRSDEEFCAEFLKRHFSEDLEQILADPEMRGLFLPQLRADYKLIETYQYNAEEGIKLDCPIIALDGDDVEDCTTEEQLQGWQQYTVKAFNTRRFTGDHFYLQSDPDSLLKFLRFALLAKLSKTAPVLLI